MIIEKNLAWQFFCRMKSVVLILNQSKKVNLQIIKYHILILFCMCSYTSSFSQIILDKPIIFDDTRIKLSLMYMKDRYGLQKDFPEIDPKIVVIHWTGFPDLEASHNIMNDPTLSESRTDIKKAGILNVSAHYLVARNGEIYRMLPDTVFARHVIGLNYNAIGIENVGSKEHPLTDAQLKANVQLIKKLKNKYDIQFVIGHYEYKNFIGHPLWMEKDASYLTEKTDPGVDFMKRIRKQLKGYQISSPPDNN